MNGGDNDLLPPYISSYQDGPYNPSIASSASSSQSSVWSDAASQSSDDSSAHSDSISDSDHSDSFSCTSQQSSYQIKTCAPTADWPQSILASVVPEQRPHPRRRSTARTTCPPPLVRQSERKVNFVDSLVDSSAQIVEAIWPLSSIPCRAEIGAKGVLPLRTFIQETLRRSRTSYSTLQVALYYLILIKAHVPRCDFTMEQSDDATTNRALQCGRRMFLSALILASKYLQDRNYSSRAWSKICGLTTQEINQNEICFLKAVNWGLHIPDTTFQQWTDIVLRFTSGQPPSADTCVGVFPCTWKTVILQLDPQLENADLLIPPSTPVRSFPEPTPSYVSPVFGRLCGQESDSKEATPTPRTYAPLVLEPALPETYPVTQMAPVFGLLPTPRLTPQSSVYSTPAVGVASYSQCSKSAMSFAMSQAACTVGANLGDRWPSRLSPTYPQLTRRSSLAHSVSSMSSPESMISDRSRSSRSSSISSASSSVLCAPTSSKLDRQARCRYARQCEERQNQVAIQAFSDCGSEGYQTSPEPYAAQIPKSIPSLSLCTPAVQQQSEGTDYFSKDSAVFAARTLQEMAVNRPEARRAGSKRGRSVSGSGNTLQDNVRGLLCGSSEATFPDALMRPRVALRSATMDSVNGTICSLSRGIDGRKRVCCSSEAANEYPGLLSRPGMWEGILN